MAEPDPPQFFRGTPGCGVIEVIDSIDVVIKVIDSILMWWYVVLLKRCLDIVWGLGCPREQVVAILPSCDICQDVVLTKWRSILSLPTSSD